MVPEFTTANAFVEEAKKSINDLRIDPAMVTQFAGAKAMIDATLDGLLAAETQQAFDAQVASAMEAFMGKPAMVKAEAPAPKRGGKRGRRR